MHVDLYIATVMKLAMLMRLTAGIYAIQAPGVPLTYEKAADYAAVLTKADAWWFCILYFVTFGGFVGLSSFFNTFFVDQFDAPRAAVGLWTWPFIIAGSFLRPVGGALSDRLGGIRMLTLLYGVVVLCALGLWGASMVVDIILLHQACSPGIPRTADTVVDRPPEARSDYG